MVDAMATRAGGGRGNERSSLAIINGIIVAIRVALVGSGK